MPGTNSTPEHATQLDKDERRFFDKLYKEWIPLHDNRPRVVYHYTTAAGLLGIVQSNRLWATNARFLNDLSEIEYAALVIRQLIFTPVGKESSVDRNDVSGAIRACRKSFG